MIKSNITLDNLSYCAAYKTQDNNISLFVTGKDAVHSLMESAKGTDAVVYCFTDKDYALQEYASAVNRIHSGKLRYQEYSHVDWEDLEKEERSTWYKGVDGGLYEDFEQSIGE